MATFSTSTQSAPASQQTSGQTYRGPFAIMTILFFLWGFINVCNDILIPRFKEAFALNYFQAMLVQLAFFGAYSIGGLVYYLISVYSGDPINRIGYRKGVIIGLLISAVGSALFYPAATMTSYALVSLKASGGTQTSHVGAPTLSVGDIKDVQSLAAKLRAHSDPLSLFLWGRLSEGTRQQALKTGAEEALAAALVKDLNEVMRTELLYQPERFAGVTLSDETKSLVGGKLEGLQFARRNRLLVEEAYPGEIARSPYVIGARVAGEMTAYPFFLGALFIVGLGLAMLQVAANPYVTILGPERTASSRLNLSQAFNSFGTTIGPIIGGWLIFTVFARPGVHGADSVKIPYLGFAAVFILLALFFAFTHLPNFANTEKISRGLGALRHPHMVLGMVAIFMYVGGEITTGSAIVNFLGTDRLGHIERETASGYLAFYWGGLMIGRFMGAFALSDLRKTVKRVLVVAVPVTAFVVILALPDVINALHLDWTRAIELCSPHNARCYGLGLAVLLVAFFLGESSPSRMLAIFSGIIIVLLVTGIASAGETAKWAILGVGMFCSVMWSNIFSLAIEGLGPLKSQASSLLVVAILGGALLPPTQGKVADHWGIQFSFIVPIVAFAYIAFYGLYGYRAGRSAKAAA